MTQYGISPLYPVMGDLEFVRCLERLVIGAFGVPQEMLDIEPQSLYRRYRNFVEMRLLGCASYYQAWAKENQNAGYYTRARVIALPFLGQPAWDNEQDHEDLVESMRALHALAIYDPDNAQYARWKANLIEVALIG